MKRIGLVFLLMSFCCCIQAQQKFIKTASGIGYGTMLRVLPAANGGWVVFSRDSLKLTRFNSCGFSLWSKKYSLPSFHYAETDFISTQNGGYAIMTRMFNGSIYGSLITVLDSSGNITWCKSYEDPSYNQVPYTLNEDQQGNFILYANIEHVNLAPYYNMLCKIDPNGNILWTRFYDHGGIWGGAICTSDNGVLARTGTTFIKTDQNGNEQWTSIFYSSTYDYYRPVEVSDGYIFTGYNTIGTNYISFYKMDKQGNLLWVNKKRTNLGGPTPELQKKSNGNFTAKFSYNTVMEFDKDLNVIGESNPDLSSQGITLVGRDMCILPGNIPVLAGVTNGAEAFFIARMDQQYHTGCDGSLPAMTITPEPVTQAFIPTNVTSFTLGAVNRIFQVDTFSVSMTTVCNITKQLDLGKDTLLCQGSTMVLQNLTGDLFDHYSWSTGATTSSITIHQAGTYWLFAFDDCEENQRSDTVWINIKPVVAADLGENLFKCENKPVTLYAPFCGTCSFTWSTGSIADSIEAVTEGTYWLKVDNNNGCITSDTVEVDEVKCECFLYVPNAFTPNADGINESFGPSYDCDIQDFNMSIFNRWGQLVYQTSDRFEQWKGNFKGKQTTEGIYVYVIKYTPLLKGKSQDRVTKSGTVAVIY